MPKLPIRTLSLFTGAGGLDLGFHEAGFEVVGCLEIDTPSCETLKLNVGKYVSPKTKLFNEDITAIEPSALELGKIDFMIGGPPCQSFSAAGRRAGGVHGINDTRGSLFWYYCKYLKHFKPAGFLFENVKGILQANKSEDWNIIVKSFESVGYRLSYRVLDAADFGTPQHRERVILVGVRDDLSHDFRFPAPTHGPGSKTGTDFISPAEALSDLFDPNEEVPAYGGKYGHLLADIPPGRNYLYYTEKMGHPNPQFAWRSKFSGFLYKLPKDEPSKTIVAHQGRYDGPFHWNNRKLNTAELKRLQGFPDDYDFVNSKVETVRQIGNSVAPKMAKMLALAVKRQIFGSNSAIVELDEKSGTGHHSKRKAIKAARTKASTRTSNRGSHDQQDLFAVKRKYELELSRNQEVNVDGIKFQSKQVLSNGRWDVTLSEQGARKPIGVKISLTFANPAGCYFNKVEAFGTMSSVLHLSLMWDCIHTCVEDTSSYESLLPLYGHFTEPHPKFRLELEFSGLDDASSEDRALATILKHMSDFNFLSRIHDYQTFFETREEAEATIKALRNQGFDIRTNETNRAIKQGFFRPCYPFSNYSKTNSYIAWTERGLHKTGDVSVSIEDGQVVIGKAV